MASKSADVTEEYITEHCNKFCWLLGLLDAIWSLVRGIDGLLPTEEQKEKLKKAIAAGKALWIDMKLSTQQPKWHLTFDGHLLDQFCKYDGLSDKSDESIEKVHQILKALEIGSEAPYHMNNERPAPKGVATQKITRNPAANRRL